MSCAAVVLVPWGSFCQAPSSQTLAAGEGGAASGLPFSGGMSRDHAVTPGMMEMKLFSILPCHTGRKVKAQES